MNKEIVLSTFIKEIVSDCDNNNKIILKTKIIENDDYDPELYTDENYKVLLYQTLTIKDSISTFQMELDINHLTPNRLRDLADLIELEMTAAKRKVDLRKNS